MRLIKRLLLIMTILAAAAAGWMVWFAYAALPLKLNARGVVEVDIRPGQGLKSVAQTLAEAGVGLYPWQFVVLGRLLGRDRQIKAGSYEVGPGETALSLLDKLTAGDMSLAELLIVEGKTFREMRALIDAHPDLRHDSAGLTDAEILQRIGAPADFAEGRFFPDTYLFARQSSDLELYRRAWQAMERRLAAAWAKRDPGLPYRTPEEALIMASIIEKETGHEADRRMIASVFINRLKMGMPLQSDPTVIYGLGAAFDGNLRKVHLQTDSPYNTYLRKGLPPTPICLPGQASLDAAVRPAASDYLYFVARGDGTSEFSRSLDAHNRAVAKYQLGKP